MKLSQLLHVIDKEDKICVIDFDKALEHSFLFYGEAKGIKKDNEINEMHVLNVTAYDDEILILVTGKGLQIQK